MNFWVVFGIFFMLLGMLFLLKGAFELLKNSAPTNSHGIVDYSDHFEKKGNFSFYGVVFLGPIPIPLVKISWRDWLLLLLFGAGVFFAVKLLFRNF